MTSYIHIMEGMGNGQFPLDNSHSDISHYPARLGLEFKVGLVGFALGLVLGLGLELELKS